VREEKYGYDSQETRQYFPYTAVKNGVLDTYADLFGLVFERATDIATWHPDVEAYRLRKSTSGQRGDGKGQILGVFYLDMHPRDDKYKHAAMFPMQTGLATGRLPIASLVCNFPNPTSGDALMEHQDVETFFHEFGHLLHQLLASRASFVNLGGIAVEWDFVEAPSQILEEWAWSHEVLARFAKHVKTGEVIPVSLVEKMGRSDEFGKGAETMRQLFFAAYSYFLHERDPAKVDLEAFSDEIFAKFSPYARVPGDRIYCNFGHLIGYSSAYYTYQWSLMIAKDLFGRFAKAGIMDRATAQAYADTILAPGGLKDSVDLVQDFLGRPFSLDAYRAWLSE
ncbi:MAG: peptidase M3, partial [Myxococcales bacterium]|nr:peptidase M3 [Myxococcales bacterium]